MTLENSARKPQSSEREAIFSYNAVASGRDLKIVGNDIPKLLESVTALGARSLIDTDLARYSSALERFNAARLGDTPVSVEMAEDPKLAEARDILWQVEVHKLLDDIQTTPESSPYKIVRAGERVRVGITALLGAFYTYNPATDPDFREYAEGVMAVALEDAKEATVIGHFGTGARTNRAAAPSLSPIVAPQLEEARNQDDSVSIESEVRIIGDQSTDTGSSPDFDPNDEALIAMSEEADATQKESLTEDEQEVVVDSLRQLLNESARIPLLTKAQEVELAKAIEAGKAAKSRLASNQVLDTKERDGLEDNIEKSLEARNTLVASNIRLVVSVAKRYLGRGLELKDLVGEGMFGLFRAAEKFDYRRGFRFSTYSYWWIKQAISRGAVDYGRTVRIPNHMNDTINHFLTTYRDMQNNLGGNPSNQEVADFLEVPITRIQEYWNWVSNPISLATPVGEEGEEEMSDLIVDRTVDLHEEAERSEISKMLYDALEGYLTVRERQVLCMRFKLGEYTDKNYTLGDIGQELGISRERARQIEAEAIRKLRRTGEITQLAEYLQ